MRRSLRTYLKLVALLPMLAMLLPAVLRAERTAVSSSRPAHVRCYCGCDSKAGAHQCNMMCDLPKYENRSWAVNCHKSATPFQKAPEPPNHSTRHNGEENCKR
jgi:hypothetical protein